MSSKTKIVVLHMKEVIYTGIFLLLLIIFGIVMFFMFGSGKSVNTSSHLRDTEGKYTPGIYRSSIELNNNVFDVEVTVDSDQITSIDLVNMSHSTAAMYPLMQPALETLASQIYVTQSLDDIEYADDQKYTSIVLLRAIRNALELGQKKN